MQSRLSRRARPIPQERSNASRSPTCPVVFPIEEIVHQLNQSDQRNESLEDTAALSIGARQRVATRGTRPAHEGDTPEPKRFLRNRQARRPAALVPFFANRRCSDGSRVPAPNDAGHGEALDTYVDPVRAGRRSRCATPRNRMHMPGRDDGCRPGLRLSNVPGIRKRQCRGPAAASLGAVPQTEAHRIKTMRRLCECIGEVAAHARCFA